jgi:hypothetical protein
VVVGHDDCNSQSLLAPEHRSGTAGFSLLHPGRFSMRQSYSVAFSSSSLGSLSSGVYLNTLSYQLADPLTLSVDLGFYSPFYSTIPGLRDQSIMARGGAGTSFILPHVGLEYKPSDNFSMNLGFVNGPDAWKAYGGPFHQPFWSRSP